MGNTRIAVIDSGISPLSKVSSCVVDSYVLQQNECEWKIKKAQIEDFVGHGTAVSHIIWDTNKNIEIVIFRICDNELVVDESGLVKVLEYILNNIEVNIINISAGITYLHDYNALNNICLELSQKGIIIVSAFDNDGAISYPAAFDCVIGIDVKRDIEKNEIVHVINGIANILVPDKYFRTDWLSTKTIIRGTSFACAYVSGLLTLAIDDFTDVVSMIESISSKEIIFQKHQAPFKPNFNIRKAIIFPINKESHALLRFRDKLDFEIIGSYDDRLSGKVGKTILGERIQSYDDIDWDENFDTVILSCVSELTALTNRNYIEEIVCNAKNSGKYIYSFEPMPLAYSAYDRIFYPSIMKSNVPKETDLKLHKTTIPVVGVVGTSSKQGKFTLQQKLIYQLLCIGYKVGSIITEPSGYLFNADYVFHFGYHANLDLLPYEYITILNEMTFGVQLNKKDILITGCQSGVVHYNNSNVNEFAISQYSFLLGTLPDIFILCVNPHDNIDYIKKSINFLNSIDEGKVKALVIFPIKAITTLSGIGYKVEEIDTLEFYEIKNKLESEFRLPAFSMNDEDIYQICSVIIDELSNDQ
jgi:uncharacterized NAD-dependent epimerase/dehydratase family protein